MYNQKIANVELNIIILNLSVHFTSPVLYKKNMPNRAKKVPKAACDATPGNLAFAMAEIYPNNKPSQSAYSGVVRIKNLFLGPKQISKTRARAPHKPHCESMIALSANPVRIKYQV